MNKPRFSAAVLFFTLNLTAVPATAALVDLRLEVTLLDGTTPLPATSVGEPFLLNVYVQDLSDPPAGVFAVYADIVYDSGLVSLTGPLVYGPVYPNGQTGDTSTPGVIDEAGAFDGFTPLGGGEFLLFRAPFLADAPGTALFSADPADDFPASFTLFFGETNEVPLDEIGFGSTELLIRRQTPPPAPVVPEPGTLLLFCTGLLGAAGYRRRRK